jgi:hypothetical protein
MDAKDELIEDLKARLAQLKAERAADAHTRLSEEIQPEPGPSFYAVSQHPDVALAGVLASGHAVGEHPGLGAAASN